MMEIRLEAKTLVIGILLGVVITIVLGSNGGRDGAIVRATGGLVTSSSYVGNAERTDYALSIGQNGFALVRVQNGDFFIVNPLTGMATRVLHSRRLTDDPTRTIRDFRGLQFNYSVGVPAEAEKGGDYGK